jgi:hypothetical protein
MGTHAFIDPAANTFVGYMQALGSGWPDEPSLPLFMNIDLDFIPVLRKQLVEARFAILLAGTRR